MWWRFRIAQVLGRSIDEVFAFSKSELAHWIAYLSDNPEGAEFQDRMNALLCATIERNRWGNTDAELHINRYLLHPENRKAEDERERRRKEDPERQAQEIEAYVAALNNLRGEA